MIINANGVDDSIEEDALIGIPIERMAIIVVGTEQRTTDNIANYFINLGRIEFKTGFGGTATALIIVQTN